MTSTTLTRTVRAPSRLACVDLTPELNAVVANAGVESGCCVVFCRHTTCALLINEWETGLLEDLRDRIARLVPADGYYAHDDFGRRTENLTPDERVNGPAHVAQMLMGGVSHMIPVIGGHASLGTWQRLIFFELDEPADREILFHVFGSAAPQRATVSSTQSFVRKSQNASPANRP